MNPKPNYNQPKYYFSSSIIFNLLNNALEKLKQIELEKNNYKILGINPSSNIQEINNAELNLLKIYHPGNFTDLKDKKIAAKIMKIINDAHDNLIKNIETPHEDLPADVSPYSIYSHSTKNWRKFTKEEQAFADKILSKIKEYEKKEQYAMAIKLLKDESEIESFFNENNAGGDRLSRGEIVDVQKVLALENKKIFIKFNQKRYNIFSKLVENLKKIKSNLDITKDYNIAIEEHKKLLLIILKRDDCSNNYFEQFISQSLFDSIKHYGKSVEMSRKYNSDWHLANQIINEISGIFRLKMQSEFANKNKIKAFLNNFIKEEASSLCKNNNIFGLAIYNDLLWIDPKDNNILLEIKKWCAKFFEKLKTLNKNSDEYLLNEFILNEVFDYIIKEQHDD